MIPDHQPGPRDAHKFGICAEVFCHPQELAANVKLSVDLSRLSMSLERRSIAAYIFFTIGLQPSDF